MILNLFDIEEILLGAVGHRLVVYVPKSVVQKCSEHHWVTVCGGRTRIKSQHIIINQMNHSLSIRIAHIFSCINMHLKLQNWKTVSLRVRKPNELD